MSRPNQSPTSLTASVTPDLKAKVQQLADQLGISQADLVRQAIVAFLQSTDRPKAQP